MKLISKQLRALQAIWLLSPLVLLGGVVRTSTLMAQSGTFTPTGSLKTARSAHTATLIPSGKVLIAGSSLCSGGFCASQLHFSAELYEPVAGTFMPAPNMSKARSSHTATIADRRALDGDLLLQ